MCAMRIIFLSLLMLIAEIYSNEIDHSNECLINYLRKQNYDDEIFNKTAYVENLSDSCTRRIISEKDNVFMTAHQKYERNAEFKRDFDCFMDSVRNDEQFIHLLLKMKAIQSIKLNWKAKLNPRNWFSGKKKKALNEVEDEIRVIEFENLFNCEYGKKFGDTFDLIYEIQTTHGRSNIEDACVRNYLTKSSATKGTSHQNFNCEELLDMIKSEIFTTIQSLYSDKKKNVRKCLNVLLLNEDIFQPAMKIKLEADRMDKNAKENARKVYVNKMKKIFKKHLRNCL